MSLINNTQFKTKIKFNQNKGDIYIILDRMGRNEEWGTNTDFFPLKS